MSGATYVALLYLKLSASYKLIADKRQNIAYHLFLPPQEHFPWAQSNSQKPVRICKVIPIQQQSISTAHVNKSSR